jgi:hypothetical protein
MSDTPEVDHPPPLSNSVNTIEAEFLGAITNSVITTARRPKRCTKKTKPSTIGSFSAKIELKRIANDITAMHRRVP